MGSRDTCRERKRRAEAGGGEENLRLNQNENHTPCLEKLNETTIGKGDSVEAPRRAQPGKPPPVVPTSHMVLDLSYTSHPHTVCEGEECDMESQTC